MHTRRCQYCEQDRRIPEEITGHGSAPTCRACSRENRRAYNREWTRRRQGKPCLRCGGPKPQGRGVKLCPSCAKPKRPKPKRERTCGTCGTEVGPRRRTCDPCKLERRRANSRRWNRTHPEAMRAATRRYQHRHPERARAAAARWYAEVRADPKRWAALLETSRMSARLRAERLGRPMRPVPEERYPDASTQWTVPAGPTRQLVAEWVQSGGNQSELSRAAGVSERLIYRLLYEGTESISVGAADRLVVAMGLHLHLLYEEAA